MKGDQIGGSRTDNTADKLARKNRERLFPDLLDLEIERNAQSDNCRFQQELDILASCIIRFIRNISHFKHHNDQDDGNENGIQYDRFQSFLNQLCAPEKADCQGNGKQFTMQEFVHRILRISW